jgi:formate-dependent nitrite reductase cytochrome c552 subunit
MKKKSKRLALHRETVRNLDDIGLKGVVGGTWTRTGPQCATSCQCIDYQDTFSADCTADCPTTSLG